MGNIKILKMYVNSGETGFLVYFISLELHEKILLSTTHSDHHIPQNPSWIINWLSLTIANTRLCRIMLLRKKISSRKSFQLLIM